MPDQEEVTAVVDETPETKPSKPARGAAAPSTSLEPAIRQLLDDLVPHIAKSEQRLSNQLIILRSALKAALDYLP